MDRWLLLILFFMFIAAFLAIYGLIACIVQMDYTRIWFFIIALAGSIFLIITIIQTDKEIKRIRNEVLDLEEIIKSHKEVIKAITKHLKDPYDLEIPNWLFEVRE